MTVSLLEQARRNRIEAVAFLKEMRDAEKNGATQIYDLAAARSRRQIKPVFFSRRAATEAGRLAA